MSNHKKLNTSSICLEDFGGIDKSQAHNNFNAAIDILNFRFDNNGGLYKRYGYRPYYNIGTNIRAIWSGTVHKKSIIYILVYNTVYLLSAESPTLYQVGYVNTSSGAACFFFFQGTLYLTDGQECYELRQSTLQKCVGYVPLVGKDWSNKSVGKPYEPRNILNKHARISYIVSDPPSIYLALDGIAESVEAVYLNGKRLSEEEYYLDTCFNTVNVPQIMPDDRVELYFTYKDGYSDLLSGFCSSSNAVVFGGANNSRIFFWGGNDASVMYCSSYVTPEQLEASKKIYSTSSELYIPKGFEFKVGDGRCDVMGAVCHYDRLLIFTEGNAWMADANASGLDLFPTYHVNSYIGCASKQGAILAGNDPIMIGHNTIWKWEGATDKLNERTATSISYPIDELLSPEDYKNANIFFNRNDGEIWLNLRSKGDILVYNIRQKKWSRFDGINADMFLDIGDNIGFIKNGYIFVFDKNQNFDTDEHYSKNINSIYISGIADFNSDRIKTLSDIVLRGDMMYGSLDISFHSDSKNSTAITISSNNDTHSIKSKKFHPTRFRYGTLRITSSDSARPCIHSIELNIR